MVKYLDELIEEHVEELTAKSKVYGAITSDEIDEASRVSKLMDEEKQKQKLTSQLSEEEFAFYSSNGDHVKKTQKLHANTGNQNAVKAVKKDALLTLRCTFKEKALWVKSAEGKKLAQWVTETLNEAVNKNLDDSDRN